MRTNWKRKFGLSLMTPQEKVTKGLPLKFKDDYDPSLCSKCQSASVAGAGARCSDCI